MVPCSGASASASTLICSSRLSMRPARVGRSGLDLLQLAGRGRQRRVQVREARGDVGERGVGVAGEHLDVVDRAGELADLVDRARHRLQRGRGLGEAPASARALAGSITATRASTAYSANGHSTIASTPTIAHRRPVQLADGLVAGEPFPAEPGGDPLGLAHRRGARSPRPASEARLPSSPVAPARRTAPGRWRRPPALRSSP